MAATMRAVCPGCKNVVRLPEDWGNQALRCKFCGMVSQARPTAAALARQATALQPAASPAAVTQVSLPEISVAIPTVLTTTPVPRNTSAFPLPVPPLTSAPANGWEGLSDDPTGDTDAPTVGSVGRHRYRRNRSHTSLFVAVAILMLCVGGALAVALIAPKIKKEIRDQEAAKEKTPSSTPTVAVNTPATNPVVKKIDSDIPEVHSKYPRRLLGICVSNYLYANPVDYGGKTARKSHDFATTLKLLG